MQEYVPDKTRYKDEKGRYIVQGLFLEVQYNTDLAVFTLDGVDKTYKGVVYPSLKRLYLECADPKEYTFANKYLFDWDHWQRVCRNSMLRAHVDKWREELELSLISEGVSALIDLALNEKSYQAAKYLAERGWDKKARGRPSQDEVAEEIKKRADMETSFDEDFQLLKLHKGK
jgi:hypothetical protein